MKDINKALVALQNTIIHMGRPVFVIDKKNYKIVCDTPLSRERLGVYIGMTLQEALGEEVTLSYLKNHVIKNAIANEVISFFVEEIIEDYYLIIPNLNKTTDYLENLVNDLFLESEDAKAILDEKKRIIAANKQFEDIFGFSNDEIISKSLEDILQISDSERNYIKEYEKNLRESKDISISGIRKTKYGKREKMSIVLTPITSQNDVIGIQVTYKMKNSVEDINLASYKKIIDNDIDGVIIADQRKKIVYVNKAMTKMFQYHSTEFEKMKFLDKSTMVFSEPYVYQQMIDSIKLNDYWQGESWERRRDNTIIPTWKQVIIIRDDHHDITRYVATYKDLSNVSTANMSKMINKDPLTSLYTKQHFINNVDQMLKKEVSHQKILFMDIDNFKDLNDNNGHALGDKLLVEISRRIVVSFSEQVKARYAGDEFVIHFSNKVTEKETLELILNFKEAMKEPIRIDNKIYQVSISMGLAVSPKDGITCTELLDNADKNMYINKNSNRRII